MQWFAIKIFIGYIADVTVKWLSSFRKSPEVRAAVAELEADASQTAIKESLDAKETDLDVSRMSDEQLHEQLRRFRTNSGNS